MSYGEIEDERCRCNRPERRVGLRSQKRVKIGSWHELEEQMSEKLAYLKEEEVTLSVAGQGASSVLMYLH